MKGVGYDEALALQREREAGGAFEGIDDLLRRAPLRTDQVEQLVMAGACDCFEVPRRQLLWQIGVVARGVREQAALELPPPEAPRLRQLSLWDEVLLDYSTQGLSVRQHPVELLRPMLGSGVVHVREACEVVEHGRQVDVVGAVVVRQKPATAKGIVFLLLEDGGGQINVVVHRELYRAARTAIRGEAILRVRGRIERHGRVVNLVATEIHRLPRELRSRAPVRMRGKAWG